METELSAETISQSSLSSALDFQKHPSKWDNSSKSKTFKPQFVISKHFLENAQSKVPEIEYLGC